MAVHGIEYILFFRYNESATQAQANRVTDAAQEQGKSFVFNFKNIILNIL